MTLRFTDPEVSDAKACARIWTMFVRCGFAPNAHVDDNDEEEDEMGGKRATAEETAEITRRVGAGETVAAVAADLDRHPTFVRKIATDAGIDVPNRRGQAGGRPATAVHAPPAAPEASPAVRRAPRPRRSLADALAVLPRPAARPARTPAAMVKHAGDPSDVLRAERDRLRAAADALDVALGLLGR